MKNASRQSTTATVTLTRENLMLDSMRSMAALRSSVAAFTSASAALRTLCMYHVRRQCSSSRHAVESPDALRKRIVMSSSASLRMIERVSSANVVADRGC